MDEPETEAVRAAIRGLMVSENQGDVHEVINGLCDLAGIPRPEGDFLNGWTEADRAAAGFR